MTGPRSCTVVVATFGDPEWRQLAQRAVRSAATQGVPVIHAHGETLADARQRGLDQVETPWVVHLDADDELEPGYFTAMRQGTADIRCPLIRFMIDGRQRNVWQPRVAGHRHDCTAECITSGAGNWLPIGVFARVALLQAAGGWRDWPVYEDFDLWMRALLEPGATCELVPGAVYRAHVRPDSRNRAPDMAWKNEVHRQIVRRNLGIPISFPGDPA